MTTLHTQKTLRLAPGLDVPVDVVTQKLAFLGRTGSGKTYAATKLAELMLGAGSQVICLDPVGVHYGLRLGANGAAGLEIPIFGGLHGDLPLESTAGAVMADLVVDRGISAVLDVSQFETDAQKARFAEAFASRFFFRKKASPSPVHLFLEECQEFAPQNPQGGDAQMLHAFTRLAKLGRNFGIGLSLISQRPQEVNKKVLNMTEVLFAFQMRGPQERKTIKDWSADKDVGLDIVDVLPSLKVGQCMVSSPQWLEIEATFTIAKKQTADVSSTPKVGASARPAEPLTPIDLEQLRTTMAATIEKAKAEDPKLLTARIRQLEAELKAKSNGKTPHAGHAGTSAPAIDETRVAQRVQQAVDVAVHEERKRQDRLRRILKQAAQKSSQELARAGTTAQRIGSEIIDAANSLAAVIAGFDDDWHPVPAAPAAVPARVAPPVPITSGNGTARMGRLGEVEPHDGLNRPQQRMLNAMATMEELAQGLRDRVPRNIIAALSNQSPRSSGWEKNLSTLRSRGYITYPDADSMTLTGDGRTVSRQDTSVTSLADLHDSWRQLLSGPQWLMCEALISVYPDAMDRGALAATTRQSSKSSGWEKNLSTLRSLGVLEYPDRDSAIATHLLFPPGLA